jgi:general nucleoside transport system permease protein
MRALGFAIVPRSQPSRLLILLIPVLTVAMTAAMTIVLFSILGAAPRVVLYTFFVEPLSSLYNIGEVLIKGSPLILIAQGLAVGFRAKVWNIGAEGQLIIGAICASLIPIHWADGQSAWMLPGMIVTGALAGMIWAGIAAFFRTRFNASEIIVTLMLTEIARQILYYLIVGPLRDPRGFNFPQSVVFPDAALYPTLWEGSRANLSIFITLTMSVGCWLFATKSFAAYRLLLGGIAPDAARYAGFSENNAIWISLLVGGAAAGLAGVGEVAGPIGKLQPILSPGYGYAGIIVAFLGGLNAVGIVCAGLFMAIIYVGGDNALVSAQIPSAATVVFQGLLMVFYLAIFMLVDNRVERVHRLLPAGAINAST